MSNKRMPPYCLPEGTCLQQRYYVRGMLGEGGFGITYEGWDQKLSISVAIKEYYPKQLIRRTAARQGETGVYSYGGTSMTEEYRKGIASFLQEAQNLARFNQLEGVAVVRDYFAANGTAYIVMEYIQGSSIDEYVRNNGPIPAEKVRSMMKPVWEALQIMHRNHVIHRDVSADNLLLTGGGKLKLVDFGAARSLDQRNHTMTVMYKRGFAPEEQYRIRGEIGPWSDIYSVCAVMYYMLSGVMPEEASQRLVKDQTRSLGQLQKIALPEGWSDAIAKGMAVMAADRFQCMEELLRAMGEQTVPESEAVIFPADSPYEKEETNVLTVGLDDGLTTEMVQRELSQVQKQSIDAKRKTARNRNAMMAVVFAVVVLLAVGVWWQWQRKETEKNTYQTAGNDIPVTTQQTDAPGSSGQPVQGIGVTAAPAAKTGQAKADGDGNDRTGDQTTGSKTTGSKASGGKTTGNQTTGSKASGSKTTGNRKSPAKTSRPAASTGKNQTGQTTTGTNSTTAKNNSTKKNSGNRKDQEKKNVVGSLDAVLGD